MVIIILLLIYLVIINNNNNNNNNNNRIIITITKIIKIINDSVFAVSWSVYRGRVGNGRAKRSKISSLSLCLCLSSS